MDVLTEEETEELTREKKLKEAVSHIFKLIEIEGICLTINFTK